MRNLILLTTDNLSDMKWNIKNKGLVAIASIIMFLILTNPDYSDFKDFIGVGSQESIQGTLRRRNNFFLFSLYSDGSMRYFGVVGNFIKIESPQESNK